MANISVGTKAWANKINAAWRKSAAQIIETGQMLLQCKQIVDKGGFEKMIESQLDFDASVARKLMAVAGDERIIRACQMARLPHHWTTLYELHKLNDDELQTALGGDGPPKGEDVVRARSARPVVIDVEHKDITESPAVSPAAVEAVPTEEALSPAPASTADDPEGRDTDRHDLEEEVSGEDSVLDAEPEVHTPEAVDVPSQYSLEGALLALDREESDGLTPAQVRARLPMSDDRFSDILNWLLDADQIIQDERKRPEAAA
jgi:hypothetical protein